MTIPPRIIRDPHNGNRWQVRYYDQTMGLWFDYHEATHNHTKARATLKQAQDEHTTH